MDDESGQISEIHFVHDMEQMIDPDKFVNSGIIPSIVEKVKQNSEMTSLHMNEQGSLYIALSESVAPVKIGGMFAKKNSTLPRKLSIASAKI